MRPRFLAPLIGLLLILGSIVGLSRPGIALAAGYRDTGSNPAYDIESYNFYCNGGGTSCIPNGLTAADCASGYYTCPGLNYADVEAIGPTTGAISGTPDELILFCAHGTSSEGYNFGWIDVVNKSGQADYPEPPNSQYRLYGVYYNGDPGSITGTASLLAANPSSATGAGYNPTQVSSVHASGFDPDQAVAEEYPSGEGPFPAHGTAYGVQNTDNSSDHLNSGGFTITISGWLYHVSGDSYSIYQGTITCTAGGPHAYDIQNAGLEYDGPVSLSNAEGELEHYVGDNPFFINPPTQIG